MTASVRYHLPKRYHCARRGLAWHGMAWHGSATIHDFGNGSDSRGARTLSQLESSAAHARARE